jgi:predicted lipoprotein with Yx(FWY)xxD motif
MRTSLVSVFGVLTASATGLVGAAALVGAAGPAGAASAASAPSHHTVVVSTASVHGVGEVLTTGTGMTLYRFTANPSGKSTCTGVCAKAWPPYLAAKGAHINGPHGVHGLSLISVGGGHYQVAFHNAALYRFAADSKKGDAKGQGLLGKWFAASKSWAPAGASAHMHTTTSTTSSGGGYKY